MSNRTIEQLERELHGDAAWSRPDLPAIRSAGRRRRRRTASGVGAGGLAALVLVGLLLDAGMSNGGRAVDQTPVARYPHVMTPLSERVLAEIPGASQVSDWQVVVPAPESAHSDGVGEDIQVAHLPVDTGARHYAGVTSYGETDFPAWLYDGVARIERTQLGSDASHPVGSTDMGILVDTGPAYLGCATSSSWGSGPCTPALLTRSGDDWVYEWGMGTDDFLEPGSDMEVFLSDDYSAGKPGQLVLAGLPGTDVARVDIVTVDGTTVPGHVESGSVVDGASMMWGTVVGDVAAVVAYDADGDVIERHKLKACSDPVDCEVR